ncbi:hypothetical protein [Clostridium sp. KNHs214]|uniref:YncE family protein n=1 Tax=Clostridium sp. KNHs214 TaxID=1540257 RepID=UPI0005560E32|nr:hypothetical protein [Clostridium sp. KNHs214]
MKRKIQEFKSIDGKHLKDIRLNCLPSNIVIDKNDIAYITNRDKNSFWDQMGEKITIIDTKKDEIIGELERFKGPSTMVLKDFYLFISDTGNNVIVVIDIDSKKLIGRINLGKGMYPYNMAIIKN